MQLTVPFSRTAFSSKASFEVRSPKLLNVRHCPHTCLWRLVCCDCQREDSLMNASLDQLRDAVAAVLIITQLSGCLRL